MESDSLIANLPYLAASGHTLSLQERTAMQSSLLVLRARGKFHSVFFWGKIFGSEQDYLIAQGVYEDYAVADAQGRRRNYYSFDGLDWFDLEPLSAEDTFYAGRVHGLLTGKPHHIYRVPKSAAAPGAGEHADGTEPEEAAEAEGAEDEDGEVAKKPKSKPYVEVLEQKRLEYLVERIDHDTRVVPRGSFLLNSSQQVVPNRAFEGLHSETEATRLSSFLHLRRPESLTAKSLLEREHLSRSFDCLDSVADDKPVDQWSLHYDPVQALVSVRNLQWPGSFSFARPGSRVFGSVYFGYGQLNFDLGFLL